MVWSERNIIVGTHRNFLEALYVSDTANIPAIYIYTRIKG